MKWERSLSCPLRERKESLKPQDKEYIKSFFKGNPAIEIAYEFKEKLCKLLNKKSQMAKQCSKNIRKLKEMMKAMGYETPTNFRSTSKIVEWWKKKRAKRTKNVLQCPMC